MPVPLPGSLTPPSKVYSFTDHSIALPSVPQPGDQMDAQQLENQRSISDIIAIIQSILRADGRIANESIDFDQLSDAVKDAINPAPPMVLPPDIEEAVNEANAAKDAAQASQIAAAGSATTATNKASDANNSAAAAAASAANASTTVAAAGVIAANFPAAQTALNNATNAAQEATADAERAEQLAWLWSEKLDGPVMTEAEYAAIDPALKPPGYMYNPVGGVNGLWSAHWWAVQAATSAASVSGAVAAAQAAATAAAGSATAAASSASSAAARWSDFDKRYLGAKNADPATDNVGGPLTAGAMYFNTASATMRVYQVGGPWQNVATGGGGGIPDAPFDSFIYGRKNGAWVQVAAAGGSIPDAPVDGTLYARKDAAWTPVPAAPVPTWASITGKPSTFPPSAHTHDFNTDLTNNPWNTNGTLVQTTAGINTVRILNSNSADNFGALIDFTSRGEAYFGVINDVGGTSYSYVFYPATGTCSGVQIATTLTVRAAVNGASSVTADTTGINLQSGLGYKINGTPAIGNFSGFRFVNANTTLVAADFGKVILASAASLITITLPVGGTGWGAGYPGPALTIINHGTADANIVRQGSDFITCPPAGLGGANTSLTLRPGESVVLLDRGAMEWDVCGGSWLTSHVPGLPLTVLAGLSAGFAVGDILYADTTSSLARIADVAGGNVLRSGGVGNAPSYGKVGLTTHITGTLPVANGGTGLTALGTALQVLRTNGAATGMEWTTFGSAALADASSFEKMGQMNTINLQTGTTYTLALADMGAVVELSNAGAVTLTIPTNASVAFPVNTRIDFVQQGLGQITVAPASGVTVNSRSGRLKSAGQFAGWSMYKRGTNEWNLFGDMTL